MKPCSIDDIHFIMQVIAIFSVCALIGITGIFWAGIRKHNIEGEYRDSGRTKEK